MSVLERGPEAQERIIAPVVRPETPRILGVAATYLIHLHEEFLFPHGLYEPHKPPVEKPHMQIVPVPVYTQAETPEVPNSTTPNLSLHGNISDEPISTDSLGLADISASDEMASNSESFGN